MANSDGTKSGGREKGTPNKKKLPAMEMAEKLGCDPFEVLINFVKGDWQALGYKSDCTVIGVSKNGHEILGPIVSPEMRLAAAKEASKYLYPQRKAVELTDSDGNAMPHVLVTLPSNGRE